MQLKIQSAMHSNIEFSSDLIAFTTARVAWIIATISDPKQIEPKLVVRVLIVEPIMADEQQLLASSGEYHQVPTVPATVTCTEF